LHEKSNVSSYSNDATRSYLVTMGSFESLIPFVLAFYFNETKSLPFRGEKHSLKFLANLNLNKKNEIIATVSNKSIAFCNCNQGKMASALHKICKQLFIFLLHHTITLLKSLNTTMVKERAHIIFTTNTSA
jgi:hypothetical protein